MVGDPGVVRVERVETLPGGDPEGAGAILAARSDVVAAETRGIGVVMPEACRLAARRVEALKAIAGRHPECPRVVLGDVMYLTRVGRGLSQLVVDEGFGERIVPIEHVVAAHP